MSKTILLTGATDGIGFVTASELVQQGHTLLIHGRNQQKLDDTVARLKEQAPNANIETYLADMSDLVQVKAMADSVKAKHQHLDVLINNAGVFRVPNARTAYGFDIRFVVNTLAPYLLTKELLGVMNTQSRVINLSSAAQAPVSIEALKGNQLLDDGQAYAQSKLAITMWSRQMGRDLKDTGPLVMSVNPASFLGSKMVKEAYGMSGNDLSIGADILVRLSLSDEFANNHGDYFDNDAGVLSDPHSDALDETKVAMVVDTIEALIQ